MKKIASLLITLGIALFAPYELRNDIAPILGIPESLLALVIYAAVGSIFLGLGLFICYYVWVIGIRLPEQFSDDFFIERISSRDIGVIDQLSSEAFGIVASNSTQIQTLHELSKEIFWKVIDRKTDATVGYFCVFRLTKYGVEQIRLGIFNAPCPDPRALISFNKSNCPIYIGAIFAKGKRAKGIALAGMSVYLQQISPTSIYAKAATKDGLRLLNKHGFQPVGGCSAAIGNYFVRQGG